MNFSRLYFLDPDFSNFNEVLSTCRIAPRYADQSMTRIVLSDHAYRVLLYSRRGLRTPADSLDLHPIVVNGERIVGRILGVKCVLRATPWIADNDISVMFEDWTCPLSYNTPSVAHRLLYWLRAHAMTSSKPARVLRWCLRRLGLYDISD